MKSVFAALVLILAAGGCAAAAPAAITPLAAPRAQPAVRALVQRDGDRWTVDYRFDRDAPAWGFVDSALERRTRQPWRARQWTVETPGVELVRIGARDLLRSRDGSPVPRQVRIAFRPQAVDLEAAYATLAFSDGAVALPSGQFDAFPVYDLDAPAVMNSDLNGLDLGVDAAEVTWRDAAGPVLFKGQRRASVTASDARTYVLFGQADLRLGQRLAMVMDPNLPSWIGDQIGRFGPRVIDYYAERLGDSGAGKPTVMVAWNGPTERMASMSGSALPGLIVMSFEGQGVTTPSAEMLERSRWFIGHESAHFWLGQKVRYARASEAWITEGGADLMAVRALQAQDPAYDARAELQTEVDDCARLTVGRGVESAGSRGEHRAYYACGAVFALAAEAAQKRATGGDWFDFLRPLLDGRDVLTRQDWLAALGRVGADRTLANDVSRLLDDGAADPSAVIARLFERTGVAFRFEGGRVVLM